ncbi:hypothetical protein NL676_000001 [Syzygium grande]|nr:hypothetical protein NL676_000001 [Syzygium grande]
MASSETGTSTSNTDGSEYQVFLSFRGPDTRRGFTNCLYVALKDAGIRVFIDDEELRPGERISDNLLRAIDDSKVYIPIFSKNYASSHWCLRELAKMVENTSKSKEDGNKVILPIFYDVKPDDVKLKTPLYDEAILNLEEKKEDKKKKFSSDDVETWRQALKKVGGIKGWEPQNYSGDGELIQAIVEAVVLRDLGRAIARQDRTRLWDEGDIICELKKREIKEGAQVEALQLFVSWSSDSITVTSEEIKRFPHIRFLSLSNVNFQGDFTDCLSELRWIDLRYPYRHGDPANQRLEATNLLHLENAVVVNLTGLQFTDDVFKSLIMRARKLKIQKLPKLPISLIALLLSSTSLLTVPDLSYLTNLVELDLSNGSNSMARSNIIQTSDLRWIRKLFKLSRLRFCFPNVRAPTVEWGSLSQLIELTLYGLDLPTFKQYPSNLIVLELYGTRGKQVHLNRLPPSEKETVSSSSRKSRENKVHEQHDLQSLDVLESSKRSLIQDCKSPEWLDCPLEELGCNELQAPELIDHWRGAFQFPSSLKMLRKFILSGFPELQDIQFVSTLESLEEFSVTDCSSLKSLGGLSNLKNLKDLRIIRCMSLQVVEGIEKLEYLYELKIEGCRSIDRIFDALKHITGSASFSQLDRAVHHAHDPSSIPRSSSTTASNDDPSPPKDA